MYQDGGGKGKGKGKGKKERACYVCGKKDCLAPKCPRRWDPKERWSNPDFYKVYPPAPAGTNLNQAGTIETPRTVQEVNLPLTLTHRGQGTQQGTQMMQVPQGAQLYQVNTPDGRTIMVPYIDAHQYSQQATEQASNVNGTRPFIRGLGYSQVGTETQDNKTYGAQYVTLGSIAEDGTWLLEDYLDESDDTGSLMSDSEEVTPALMQRLAARDDRRAERRMNRLEDPFGLFWTTLMDCGATLSTYCNPEMVNNIRDARNPLHMATNVGARMVHDVANLDEYPKEVYFDEEGTANVNSMSEIIAMGYRVTMDSDVENAMIVHCGGGQHIRFVMKKGVYVCENPDLPAEPGAAETSLNARGGRPLTTNNQPHFRPYPTDPPDQGYSALEPSMPTVRSNKEGFTKKQKIAAMNARSAMHIVGAPDIRRLKQAIRAGLFKDCNLTEEALNHAEAIYGRDASVMKGKSTRITPPKVIDDWISIPKELTMHNFDIVLMVITCS